MRAACAAALLVLLGCAGSGGLKYPEPRLASRVAGFGGCNFSITFAGSAQRHSFSADDLRRDYSGGVKKGDILDEAGFDAADGGTREVAICRCMRYSIESTADRREATDALRSSIRELAEMSAAPTGWQDGSAMGRVARFEFTLRSGARVHAGANFSGNCVGTVAAIGGSEAAAKRFVDSRMPL